MPHDFQFDMTTEQAHTHNDAEQKAQSANKLQRWTATEGRSEDWTLTDERDAIERSFTLRILRMRCIPHLQMCVGMNADADAVWRVGDRWAEQSSSRVGERMRIAVGAPFVA